jgi:hypothetical protein
MIATWAHAITSTTPIVAITTPSSSPAEPTTSCFSGRTAGAIRQTSV